MIKPHRMITIPIITLLMLCSCSAPSTNRADSRQMQEFVHAITAEPRPSGSEGETRAAELIQNYLSTFGYETSLQKFVQKSVIEDQKDISGTNVIAIKKAENNKEQADILIISGHHDAKPGTQGANDDASGVAVMLEIARLVQNLSSDTEVRFISFAGEEDGRIGSRYYVEQMTEAERGRVIGNLQIDELGYINSDYIKLSTVDNRPTLLGDMLSKKAEKTIPYHIEVFSDHNSFASHNMPAVMLSQDQFAFENHSTQDTVHILEMEKLTQAARLIADVTADIMDVSTPSLLLESRKVTPTQPGFAVLKESQFYFGKDRNFVENMIATTGILDSTTTNEYGDTIERYGYRIRWFGMKTAVSTLFEYRNGFLEMIEIEMQEDLKISMEEALEQITTALGAPETNEVEFGTEYDWADSAYHKYYALIPGENGTYQILLMDYSMGKTMGHTYDLSQGMEKVEGKNDIDKQLLHLLASIIYPEDLPLIQFSVYSDGKGNSTGFTSGVSDTDNTLMQYALDSEDAIDQYGQWHEYHKTVSTVIHEYGHVLSLNSAQVDITKQDNRLPNMMFAQETFAKDAYLPAYYEQFWKEMDVNTGLEEYKKTPDNFVSAYGAANITEDFAESFMLFMLSDKPEDNTIASQKIRFFYDYDEMVARRDYIRSSTLFSQN